jgi:hypothetical protein
MTVIYTLSCPSLLATGENFPFGTRPAAMANTYVMQSDIWSVYHNQAGLGFFNHTSLGFHHENKFVVDEFSLHALAFTLPINYGTLGLSYSYFGFEDYNVSKVGLAFGKSFGSNFAAGLQLNYHYIYIAGDYESQGKVSIEGGIQYKPSENISIGMHVFNPAHSKSSYFLSDTLTTSFKTGIGYTPGEKIFIGIEVEKHLDRELIVKSGLEYRIIESLYLRTGISTKPVTNTFGLGYKIGKISADVAFTRHQILGFTPHFSLQIEW